MKFPQSADELLDELERIVPEKPSTPKTSREEDIAHGAKRELVLFLKEWKRRTREAVPSIVRHGGSPSARSRPRR